MVVQVRRKQPVVDLGDQQKILLGFRAIYGSALFVVKPPQPPHRRACVKRGGTPRVRTRAEELRVTAGLAQSARYALLGLLTALAPQSRLRYIADFAN